MLSPQNPKKRRKNSTDDNDLERMVVNPNTVQCWVISEETYTSKIRHNAAAMKKRPNSMEPSCATVGTQKAIASWTATTRRHMFLATQFRILWKKNILVGYRQLLGIAIDSLRRSLQDSCVPTQRTMWSLIFFRIRDKSANLLPHPKS